MRLPVRFVCAFSDVPHRGNPAAVVLLDDLLEEARMQAIAAELAQPITAFGAAHTGSVGIHLPSRNSCAATAPSPLSMRSLKAAGAASACCASSIAPAR